MKPRAEQTVAVSDTAEKVRRHLGDVHLVNLMDGVTGRKFTCSRCSRKLDESRFIPLPGKRLSHGAVTFTALHPHCHTCRKQAKNKCESHPLYTPELHRFWSAYLPNLRTGAYGRSIFFGLEVEDLLGKYLEQDGRCALTGIKLEPFKTSGKTKSGKHIAAPSVDRIDSSKSYTTDNIQIVMMAVNWMKGDLPQGVFIELCHQISMKNLI